jgi:hypothetical protein
VGHYPSSIFYYNTQRFGDWNLCPSSGKTHQTPVSETVCVLIKNRRWIMSNKFVILTTYHRHKPSEARILFLLPVFRDCRPVLGLVPRVTDGKSEEIPMWNVNDEGTLFLAYFQNTKMGLSYHPPVCLCVPH